MGNNPVPPGIHNRYDRHPDFDVYIYSLFLSDLGQRGTSLQNKDPTIFGYSVDIY
jgi:hypothetical protein